MVPTETLRSSMNIACFGVKLFCLIDLKCQPSCDYSLIEGCSGAQLRKASMPASKRQEATKAVQAVQWPRRPLASTVRTTRLRNTQWACSSRSWAVALLNYTEAGVRGGNRTANERWSLSQGLSANFALCPYVWYSQSKLLLWSTLHSSTKVCTIQSVSIWVLANPISFYCKVANRSTSLLVAPPRIFRLLMVGFIYTFWCSLSSTSSILE